MAPNVKQIVPSFDELITADDVDHSKVATNNELAELLDKHADTDGLKNIDGDKEDWTDVKHSERKKRDRILDDGVLIKLMRKSDYKGFERLFINLSIMALTAYAIGQCDIKIDFDFIRDFDYSQFLSNPIQAAKSFLPREPAKIAAFLVLYPFYGFQFQAFAFAGQHEFLHRNAWKTKWINDAALFLTGCFTFELGAHERVMHKQHHTYTNHIDKDPELTSYYTREELEKPGFRNCPNSRLSYFLQFLDVFSTFKMRAGRILHSAAGIAVDYSGTGWSLKEWTYSKESGIMNTLQMWACGQLLWYTMMFVVFGRTLEGLKNLAFWWICPVFVGYPVVNYFRNLEHADCEVSKDPNFLRNTRTVNSNIIIRTILWDTNYHCEHHCYPMVPFFNLHKIHELTKDHIVHSECNHFTTQNWECVKPGGWIDQQAERNAAHPKSE